MARKDDALGDGAAWEQAEAPGPARPDRRRGVLITVGGSALALALVGGLLAVQRGDAAGESASAPVALSPDGLSPQVSAAEVEAGTAVASRALAGTLPAPKKATPQVPLAALVAYRRAEASLAVERPRCHLQWWLLAGIGKVESNHAADRSVGDSGDVTPVVRGPRLDGSVIGTHMVLDTDQGYFDQDPQYDRAMGTMQFVPGTWRIAGRDGNGDGRVSPDNIYDAALSAASYLCSADADLATPRGLAGTVLRYNDHASYLTQVLSWGTYYGAHLRPAPQAPAPPSSATVPALPAPTAVVTPPAVTPTPTAPSTGPTPPGVPITVPSTSTANAPGVPVAPAPTSSSHAVVPPARPSAPGGSARPTPGDTTTTPAHPAPTSSTSAPADTPSRAPGTPDPTTTPPAPVVTTPASPVVPSSSEPPTEPAPGESSRQSVHPTSAPPAAPPTATDAPAPTGSDLPALPDETPTSPGHRRHR